MAGLLGVRDGTRVVGAFVAGESVGVEVAGAGVGVGAVGATAGTVVAPASLPSLARRAASRASRMRSAWVMKSCQMTAG